MHQERVDRKLGCGSEATYPALKVRSGGMGDKSAKANIKRFETTKAKCGMDQEQRSTWRSVLPFPAESRRFPKQTLTMRIRKPASVKKFAQTRNLEHIMHEGTYQASPTRHSFASIRCNPPEYQPTYCHQAHTKYCRKERRFPDLDDNLISKRN